MAVNYWLVKSEPEVFSFDDLLKSPKKTTYWDGVRNYQARNTLRDQMKKGDLVFFYHSNAKPPGIVGLMEVLETGLTDPSQFDPASKYHDPAAKPEAPRWDCSRLAYRRTFARMLSLDELREHFDQDALPLLRRGNRLSILPVSDDSARRILALLGESL